jgi:hypothetical protein
MKAIFIFLRMSVFWEMSDFWNALESAFFFVEKRFFFSGSAFLKVVSKLKIKEALFFY